MDGRIYVKPARTGLVVRDAHTLRPLPDDGAWVPDNQHWRRVMRRGDAVECKPPALARAVTTKDVP